MLSKYTEDIYQLIVGNKQSKLIALYSRYKYRCMEYMHTPDSFVIFDRKEETYFAVRDPLGVSPLYYTVLENKVYFSTTIQVLFQETNISKMANLKTMQNIIDYSTIAYDATMYMGIYRVPPGHYMVVSKEGKYSFTRYWKPENIEVDNTMTEEEASTKLRTLFNDAIFDCIDDIDTTGFELSGGLDSSSIVSWVKYHKPDSKATVLAMNFTGFEQCDERSYIDAVSQKYTLDIHHLPTGTMDYKEKYSLENNYKSHPHWPIFITYTMGFSVIEKAKILNLSTILTGQGGDHVFAGNPYVLYEYFKTLKWITLYREIKAVPQPMNFIKQYIIAPMLGENNIVRLRKLFYKIKGKPYNEHSKYSCGFSEFSSFYKGNSVSFRYDLQGLLHSSLSALMDSSYYAVAKEEFGITFRHPLFDRRVVEFMLSLPPQYKYSEALSKRILRKSMKGILPEKIRQRRDKAEFSEVLRQQIDVLDLDTLFHESYLAKLGLIEQKVLDKYKQDYYSGKMKKIVYFWQLINLEYWYRFHFAREEDDRYRKSIK